MTASRRSLLFGGRFAAGRYRLGASRSVAPPNEPAESRHVINLTSLAPDQYAWDTDVVYGLGNVTARDFGAFVAGLFASAEGRNEAAVRAEIAAVIPRASAVFGQMFRLDSIRTTQMADRSTLANYSATLHPEGLDKQFPNFATYVRKYIATTRIHFTITDHANAPFMIAALDDSRLTLTVRTLDGDLVPLAGPARAIPDSLYLNGALTLKIKRWTVGFRDYHADFVLTRNDRERAMSLVSRNEPQWDLPLITERLLRTPLKRPFQGSGAMFRIGVRGDSAGSESVLHRRLHLEVQESTVLRFIGKLGTVAVSDFTGKAEREQYAWLSDLFSALVEDAKALKSPP